MKIPADFPVQPLKEGENCIGRATCGVCGLSWDDAKSTQWTPAPSGRCPFEYFHEDSGEGYDTLAESQARDEVYEAEERRLKAIIDSQKQVIENLMARNMQLQQLVLSYQQDNAKDYEEPTL